MHILTGRPPNRRLERTRRMMRGMKASIYLPRRSGASR